MMPYSFVVGNNVSEDLVTFIFMVEVKMVTVSFSKTWIATHKTT
jgi:hypothetical protein